MSKRTPLGGQLNMKALAATQEKAEAGDLPATSSKMVVFSISLPEDQHDLLYDLAGARRRSRGGGRASISAEIALLIQRHKAGIEAELAKLRRR